MGKYKTIIIKPNKKLKTNIEDIISNEDLQYIQKVLEESCIDNACLTRSKLYKELKDVLKIETEQYLWEQAISAAIKSDKITGFRVRSGRNGGICKTDQKRLCTVSIDGSIYQVPAFEGQILNFITSIFQATKDLDGNININDISFKVPTNLPVKHIIETLLLNFFKAKKIDLKVVNEG